MDSKTAHKLHTLLLIIDREREKGVTDTNLKHFLHKYKEEANEYDLQYLLAILEKDGHIKKKQISVGRNLLSTTNEGIIELREATYLKSTIDYSSWPYNLMKETQSKMKKVFISHAFIDKEISDLFHDLLHTIGLTKEQLFYSSFDGYGINLGEDFIERLKEELNQKPLVIFLLSDNFYNSIYCQFEMGASWVNSNPSIPVLIPPFDFNKVKGVFRNTHGLLINEKSKLNQLKEKIEKDFELKTIDSNRWEKKRDEFIDEVDSLIEIKTQKHSNDRITVPKNSQITNLKSQDIKITFPPRKTNVPIEVLFIEKNYSKDGKVIAYEKQPNKKIYKAWRPPFLLNNTGQKPLENYKVQFQFEGDFSEVNWFRIYDKIKSVTNYDPNMIEKKSNNTLIFEPIKDHILYSEYDTTIDEMAIIPLKKEGISNVMISWRILSRDNADRGVLHLQFKSRIITYKELIESSEITNENYMLLEM